MGLDDFVYKGATDAISGLSFLFSPKDINFSLEILLAMVAIICIINEYIALIFAKPKKYFLPSFLD